MRWTLVRIPEADDELARIWTDAPDKQAAADATNESSVGYGVSRCRRAKSMRRIAVLPSIR